MVACANAAQQMVNATNTTQERMHARELKAKSQAFNNQLKANLQMQEMRVVEESFITQRETGLASIEANRQLGLASLEMTRAIFEKKSDMLSHWFDRSMDMIALQQSDLMNERNRLGEERDTVDGKRSAYVISRIQDISMELVDLNRMTVIMNNQFLYVLENL